MRAGLPILLALCAALGSSGCGPSPSVVPPSPDEMPGAAVEVPKAVKAGPYELRPTPTDATARVTVRDIDGRYDSIYVVVNFDLVRPEGSALPLRIVLPNPTILGGLAGGTSTAYPRGPKPNWRDTLSFSVSVPRGWRGDRLDLKGTLQEIASKTYEATFRNVRLEPGRPTGFPGQMAPNYAVAVPIQETATLEDGVTVRTRPQPKVSSSLAFDIAWDNRRVLPQRPNAEASVSVLKTNVGIISGGYGSASKPNEVEQRIELSHDPAAEQEAKEVRLTIGFEKPLRSYPFQMPLRLRWPSKKRP